MATLTSRVVKWQAECTCGWKGREARNKADAQYEESRHGFDCDGVNRHVLALCRKCRTTKPTLEGLCDTCRADAA